MKNDTWLTFLESFFGAIEVDIEIPEDKYEIFAEMPPIFKNVVYSEEESSPYMTNVILDLKQKFSKSRKLIASLKATRVLLLSGYLKWLVEKGVVISKVYGVIPAERGAPFQGFVDWVSNERRKGDRNTQYAIIGEAAKTVGNSAYGRTGMNKNKFQKIKYCNEQQFNRAKNNYFYYDAEEYDGMYEVTKNAKTVLQNIPIQVAFSVLNYAKLRMVEFYYDCISKYLDTTDFQYVYMDTDSAYMALTDKFENLIKPELRDEYETDKNNWFPRTDTNENQAHDKRKPGLFKIEYEGDGIIALCSKTYFTWGQKKSKFSSKGAQKERNIELINIEAYRRCLFNKTAMPCVNKGFRYVNKQMTTYEQEKIGLTPIYVKGAVMDDGVHSHPLNI